MKELLIKLSPLGKPWPFVLGLVLGISFITLTITGFSFSHFPGDLGDARFNIYLLEHAYKFLTGQINSFWNAPFMFPQPNVISYSDNLLGSAPFYAFFRVIGFDRITSFQWWFLTMSILNYACCYWFLKKIFKNKFSAVLGAMVFAFSMALQSQMTHAQTFPRFPIPLAFLAGILFMEKELKPSYFFLTILLVVYQLYCGIYLGFMLAVPIGLLLTFGLIRHWFVLKIKIKNIKWLLAMAGGGVVNLLLLMPLISPYMERAKTVGMHDYDKILFNIPTYKSHFFSQKGSLLWDFLKEAGTTYPSWWNHQIFAGGIATICLLLFGFIFINKLIHKDYSHAVASDKTLIVLFFTGLFTFLLFTRLHHSSLYPILFNLPGFGSMRAIQRIINIELIFFAIATTYLFAIVLRLIPNRIIRAMSFITVACILIADNYYDHNAVYATEKIVAEKRENTLLEKMSNVPENSIISYEPEKILENPVFYQLDAMLVSQQLNLKSINGYSATSPAGYSPYWINLNEKSRKEWLKTKNFTTDTIFVTK